MVLSEEKFMTSRVSRLPSRFPVGTRFVIEGRGGRIQMKYLEFPDGRQIDLASYPTDRAAAHAARATRRPRAAKKV
jgi:hypothetical protein